MRTSLSLKTHPQGLKLLCFTQLWESFSFFGMRALLVLYLISELQYQSQDAFLLYTLYVAFVKICCACGGYLVDRFLRYQQAVLIGGIIITAGHLFLAFSKIPFLFFIGMGSIICGSALFRTSLQALLGLLYTSEDTKREQGFTLLYVGGNLGGLSAAITCGYVAHLYGWHLGFGLAACGMALGLLFFASKMRVLPSIREPLHKKGVFIACAASLLSSIGIAFALKYFTYLHSIVLPLGFLGLVTIFYAFRNRMKKALLLSLGGAFTMLILYFAAEELWGSLLMVFSQDHIHRFICGIEIPSSVLAAMNPLIIILFGPLIGMLRIRLSFRIIYAFVALSMAFAILYIAALLPHPSVLYMVSGLACIALGEVLLVPGVLAFTAETTPSGSLGTMMGATALAFAMSSLLSGQVSHMNIKTSSIFFLIAASALGIALLVFINFIIKRSKHASTLQAKTL